MLTDDPKNVLGVIHEAVTVVLVNASTHELLRSKATPVRMDKAPHQLPRVDLC